MAYKQSRPLNLFLQLGENYSSLGEKYQQESLQIHLVGILVLLNQKKHLKKKSYSNIDDPSCSNSAR